MLLLKKPVLIILLTIAGVILGFVFLLKSCLAKYDERFCKTPALVFEKEKKIVVFSIVQFEKTTSYSQKGGMTSKSVNTQYYIQNNDGETAELLGNKKIKGHRDIKNFPVEILGATGNTAWAFIGEPMAFNPFTLDKIADIKILEEKNDQLTGKFPEERKFYNFNTDDNSISFTAKDGSKWKLNTQTLVASPSSYQKKSSSIQDRATEIEQEIKAVQVELDSLYQQKMIRPSQDYAAKKISYATYQQLNKQYYQGRDILYDVRDSLYKIRNDWSKNIRKTEEIERNIENLQRSNSSFSQIKANQDTITSQWFGIYSQEEVDKLHDKVSSQAIYDETERRNFLAGNYSISKNEEAIINKSSLKNVSPIDFLAGGFLLNKQTAHPITLTSTQSYLVVHKDQVGKEGKILITNITKAGKVLWTYNTNLTEWSDWILQNNYLFVFGVNNKNLSSNEPNILECINLIKGLAAKYDYFTQKKVE